MPDFQELLWAQVAILENHVSPYCFIVDFFFSSFVILIERKLYLHFRIVGPRFIVVDFSRDLFYLAVRFLSGEK